MYDLIIRNGKIVDGTGAPWFAADLAIRDGLIVSVGSISGEAVQEIDARGLFITPGFIDIHTHSDESVLCDPSSQSKITQGITTEVIGNCGYSAAPAVGGAVAKVKESLAEFALELTWSSFAEYLDCLRRVRPSVNLYPLVGHGILRRAVQAGPDQEVSQGKLVHLLEEVLDQGARGLSTGLIYPPGCFATTEEICRLCKINARKGGIYATHIRNEGDNLLDAVTEAITIGERSGVRVQISHLKAAGPANHGRVTEALDLILRARERGVDVAYDAYPYTASSTGLSAYLPDWAQRPDGRTLREKLLDPTLSRRLQAETEAIVVARGGWGALMVSFLSDQANSWMVGLSLAEIAEQTGQEPWSVVKELLLQNQTVEVICFCLSQADVDQVICHPLATFGSDATSRAVQGVLAQGKPHPRAFGTFPRIIRDYVRERKLLGFEEAIRKMTSAPAARLGLYRRGMIRPGFAADLVGLDYASIADQATYLEPHRLSTGIVFVLVNGGLAYDVAGGVTLPGFGQVLSSDKA